MPDPTLPVTEKPKSFHLPPHAWIIWALLAGLLGWLALSGSGSLSAREQGQIVGQIVGLLLFPTLLGWVAWRISQRSNRAGLIVFYVVLSLSFFGQLTQRAQRRRQAATAEELLTLARESKDEMRASIEKDGMITPESQDRILNKASLALSDAASSSTGEDREVALGMQAFMQWAKSCQERQTAAIQLIQLDTFFDLTQHATKEQREQKRKAVGALKEANAQLREFVIGGATWIEREMKRRQVGPTKTRAVLAGYGDSADRNRPHLMAIRELDEAFAEQLDGFITFAETHEGQWSIEKDTGQLLFPTDEAAAQFNGFVSGVQEIAAKQAALQQRLFSPQ